MLRHLDSTQAQPDTAVVTIIAKNYLAQARVLMDSVKQMNPQFLRVVLLVDEVEGCFDPEREDFMLVSSEELEIPKSRWFHFKYSVLELSTAVKPFFLRWLIHHYDLKKIIYLDPDIRVYASLAGVAGVLEDSNIVLTPHLTSELDDDRQPSELQILRTGAYNLGFIAVKATPEVDNFLLWWQSRLYDHCVVDLARGFFVDQRWIDLVPGLVPGVFILRDPGYNVAYWNAIDREITWKDGIPLANGGPLYFFHFSGYDPADPDVLSKHQDRLSLSDREDLRAICAEYRQELLARDYSTASRWIYTHGQFRNGCLIPDLGRHLLSEAPHLLDEVEDPFSDEGFERLVQLWNTPISRFTDGRMGVTKLAYRIYRLREDVQAAMPDIFGADHVRFLEWMLTSSPNEHFLTEPMLQGVRSALISAQRSRQDSPSERNGQTAPLPVMCADLLTNGAGNPLFQRLAEGKNMESAEVFNRISEKGSKSSRLTILAKYIYESRPDLQRVFPDPQGRDAAPYLAWLLNYGSHSYGLTEEYLAPLRKSLQEIRAEMSFSAKYRLDIYCLFLKTAFSLSPLTAALRKVRKFKLSGSVARVPSVSSSRLARPPERPAVTALLGVNVFGYFRAEMGVGQSARNATDALTSAGIPYTTHNLRAELLSEQDISITQFSDAAPYGTNLYFVNADQTAVIHQQAQGSPGKYRIGVWVWELDELPREWDSAFATYDEIWVPSAFCQAAIAARAPIPVIRVPYSISPSAPSHKQRQDFGIDPQKFVFLSVFDMRSCFDRKNPLGIMRAFQEAFGNTDRCELIIKLNHADASPDKLEILRSEASKHSIRLIEDTFRREDVVALIAASDCVVSLHRSEGFGLVLAEAMLLGRPVIATAYSGNLDFTTTGNSFLVSYKLQHVGPGNPPYPEHCLWADPCIEDAAHQMRTVYENDRLREQRAQAGRDLIESRFSPAAVGAAMKERLLLRRLR